MLTEFSVKKKKSARKVRFRSLFVVVFFRLMPPKEREAFLAIHFVLLLYFHTIVTFNTRATCITLKTLLL